MTSRQSGVRATYDVKWNPNERAFGTQLAALPQTQKLILKLANEVADEARKTLMAHDSGKAPTLNRPYPKVGPKGTRFSARASAVADSTEVMVKDATVLGKFKGASSKHKIGVTRVGLVIANHPYSKMWERGTFGLPKTKFMTNARNVVVGRTSGVRKRGS